ncbi:hypothetical protein NKH95_01605 [Mesorhizobium sp. M0848]|uniref:hypothetical protein n=1 Tax=Mesorhizobium sp. M0848 TaxID=2957012 RepID=UPI003335CD6B
MSQSDSQTSSYSGTLNTARTPFGVPMSWMHVLGRALIADIVGFEVGRFRAKRHKTSPRGFAHPSNIAIRRRSVHGSPTQEMPMPGRLDTRQSKARGLLRTPQRFQYCPMQLAHRRAENNRPIRADAKDSDLSGKITDAGGRRFVSLGTQGTMHLSPSTWRSKTSDPSALL